MLRLVSQASKRGLIPLRQSVASAPLLRFNSIASAQRLFSTFNACQYDDRGGNSRNRSFDYSDRSDRGGYGGYKNYKNNNNNNFRGSGRGGRGGNQSKNGSNRRGNGQSDFDASRNTSRRGGPEGDGLLGKEDYERVRELDGVSLIELAKQDAAAAGGEVEEDTGDFSKVKTELLSKHKILSQVLVNSLTENRKYLSLTEVQSQTIVPILRGDSVVVRAKTGTGKTAAFSIPAIQLVLDDIITTIKAKKEGTFDKETHQGVKAIIVSPTRELAQQIADEISAITAYGPMRDILTVCLVGGVSRAPQLRHAFGGSKVADIIVATPGRLYDVLQEPGVGDHFKNIKIKVLDEADRLLDIGFSEQLQDIDSALSNFAKDGQYQTLLFSATIDRRVRDFARMELGRNAKVVDTVSADEPEAHTLVEQKAIICDSWNEVYPATYLEVSDALKGVIAENSEKHEGDDMKDDKIFKSIIFMPTVPSVDHFAQVLRAAFKLDEDLAKELKPRVYTLHGQMTQAARQRAADEFRRLKTPTILITTDVVARGMDFPSVSHVFQMGSPRDVASYVHRIGRTGRIGHHGNASLIITKYEKQYLKLLENRKIKMKDVRVFKHSVAEEGEEEGSNPVAEHQSRLKTAFDFVDADAEETIKLVEGLLNSYAYMRKDFGVNGRDYLDAHNQFTQLFNIKDHEWSPRVKEAWRFNNGGSQRAGFWDSRGRGGNNSGRGGYRSGDYNENTSRFASRNYKNNDRRDNNSKRNFDRRY